MAASLAGVYAKLDRARHHAAELRLLVARTLDPAGFTFIRDVDGSPNRCVFRAGRVPQVDPELALVLGDFLTNMRAALDYLAWQLVRRSRSS
jgi:hypothetical protein